jgi:signal transduction histidine kinase
MSTGVIIALIVIVAVVVVLAAVLTLRARGASNGGGSLKRRFGPEYDRTVAHHDGDERAAARELAERVKRHGSLERRPLPSSERERYEARWTG